MSNKLKDRSLSYVYRMSANNTEIHIDDDNVKVIYGRDLQCTFIKDFLRDDILIDDRINNSKEQLRGCVRKASKDMLSVSFLNKEKKIVASFLKEKMLWY